MNIGDAIYTILTTDLTIAGIITDKVFPLDAPDGRALPYITYTIISDIPNKNKDRTKTIETMRVQVDVFAQTYDGVTTLADAVNDALSYYSGTVSDVEIDVIVFQDENDLHDSDGKVYRKEQDYLIRIKPN